MWTRGRARGVLLERQSLAPCRVVMSAQMRPLGRSTIPSLPMGRDFYHRSRCTNILERLVPARSFLASTEGLGSSVRAKEKLGC